MLGLCAVLLFISSIDGGSQPLNVENATEVLKTMLDKYHKEITPQYDGDPVIVSMNLFINDMVPSEKIDMHFSVDCFLRMEWVDRRLAFDNKVDPDYVLFDANVAHDIWVPNIYFPLGKKGMVHNLITPNILVVIYGNGTVKFSERLSILSFCPMDFNFYPFDIQECSFKMESYAQSISYVRLKWMKKPIERSGHDLHISDYNRVKIATGYTKHVGDFDMEFDTLNVTFTLYRDFTVYFLRDFFPCILIVCLSWVSFFLSYKATPARVAFGITTVLTIVTMTNSIRSLAPSAKTFRSLDYYMLICMMFVFGALGEYAIVGMTDPKFAKHWRKKQKKEKQDKKEVEPIAHQVINIKEANELSRSQSNADFGPLFRHRVAVNPEPEKPKPRRQKIIGPFVIYPGDQHVIDNCAKIFFPLMFLFANGIYFSYHRIHPETVD